ncbi:MAG: sel1 repeat family protein, partial [Alphaproteobacteria bacterium]|nr:sel1 repeat family protein [Alphaproteobacteria bacterium]
MRRSFLLGCALLLALARPALAADLEAGKAALAKGQYEAALKEFLPLAMGNTAEAAFQMGRILENGWGQPASDSAAWGWYKRAADLGHLDAQHAVAQMFQEGRGVPRSTRLAHKYWEMAAKLGSVKAKARTGAMAVAGLGRKRNQALGMKLLQEAAAAGDPEAVAVLDGLAERGLVAAPAAGDTDP